jgi:hypothetical protein
MLVTINPLDNRLVMTASAIGQTTIVANGPSARLLGLEPATAFILAPATATQLLRPAGFYFPGSIGVRIQTAQDSSMLTGSTPFIINTTFVVPWLAAAGAFNYQSADDFQQTATFKTQTTAIQIDLIDLGTGFVIENNGGEWEMMLTKKTS